MTELRNHSPVSVPRGGENPQGHCARWRKVLQIDCSVTHVHHTHDGIQLLRTVWYTSVCNII